MNKTMVIDTSVFIYDPEALSSFEDTRIIIPFTVIEELEGCAKFRDESAKNASRALSNIRLLLEREGNHIDGIILPNGSELRIEVSSITNLSNEEKRRKLLTLELLQIIAQREPMVFVTKSLSRRVRAEALGIESKDYENKRFSFRSLYRGYRELRVSVSDIESFYARGYVDICPETLPSPNEYFFLSSEGNYFALGRYSEKEKRIIALKDLPQNIWGIQPLNMEQKCALDLLLRDDIKLVTLMGQAGSGKTVLALAAAMYQVFDKGNYNKLLISRPIVPMGERHRFPPRLKRRETFTLDAAHL